MWIPGSAINREIRDDFCIKGSDFPRGGYFDLSFTEFLETFLALDVFGVELIRTLIGNCSRSEWR
jgi:hypothetical protein